MTPDKRATLLTAFKWSIAAALLVGGWITAAQVFYMYSNEDGTTWAVIWPHGAWMPDSPIPVGWDERDAKGV